ncbi:hypothetical protein [Methylomonas rhizoryzae]|uniref:hypothetical protein n=1 Tax=Methylomonas rhizoryzae TaxID=2608981 RepID=UPI001231C376|nr:hypothetical protein [Methylomonas rhizoryzae]
MSFRILTATHSNIRIANSPLDNVGIPYLPFQIKPAGLSPLKRGALSFGLLSVLCLASAMPVRAEFNAKQCTAQIKAKNTSPNHNIKIDKLSTAAGPIYVYGSRSPSNPHRVLDNSGAYETWTVELDSQWIDDEGTGCKQNHRVKVDLLRDGNKCSDIKFPTSTENHPIPRITS